MDKLGLNLVGQQVGIYRVDALLGVGGPAFARVRFDSCELRRGLAEAQEART